MRRTLAAILLALPLACDDAPEIDDGGGLDPPPGSDVPERERDDYCIVDPADQWQGEGACTIQFNLLLFCHTASETEAARIECVDEFRDYYYEDVIGYVRGCLETRATNWGYDCITEWENACGGPWPRSPCLTRPGGCTYYEDPSRFPKSYDVIEEAISVGMLHCYE